MQAHDSSRAIIAVSGADAVHFLQGILTQDITKLAAEKIQFAALLSPQGKILHDMMVVDTHALGHADATPYILLDTPAIYKETLLKRLALYKLRAKVAIADESATWHVGYCAQGGFADPRHPQLPYRFYSPTPNAGELDSAAYRAASLTLGIPDSAQDFAPDQIVALDAGYDLLHAISFTKGCYVGQEVTARMHYKQIARRGFYILESDTAPTRLALLKFDDMQTAGNFITLDDHAYRAHLPDWMQPKLHQFHSAPA